MSQRTFWSKFRILFFFRNHALIQLNVLFFRNHALIHYIAQLASSNNDNDTFDFSFVESLLKNGADINARDKHGQTIFHEVARSWHLDVAQFLLKNGK